jgi:hypothetical protein
MMMIEPLGALEHTSTMVEKRVCSGQLMMHRLLKSGDRNFRAA